jgi:hypothetical protein
MHGNTMQGWGHCLSHDPKPDLDMNPNRFSYDISNSNIYDTGTVKGEWPSMVERGEEQ